MFSHLFQRRFLTPLLIPYLLGRIGKCVSALTVIQEAFFQPNSLFSRDLSWPNARSLMSRLGPPLPLLARLFASPPSLGRREELLSCAL